MKVLKIFVFSISLLFSFEGMAARIGGKDWTDLARNLTGDSDAVRQRSLNKLRALKNLNQILIQEIRKPIFKNGRIDTQKLLAFDVITALGKKELLPILKNESLQDPTGYTYHTMNTLLTADQVDEVVHFYYRRLMNYPSSSAVKLALLDTLGRMGFEFSLAELRHFNRNASNEVKSALLTYMRQIMILRNRPLYQELLPEFMVADAFEIRIQTLYLYEELFRTKKLSLAQAGLTCAKDPSKTIQHFCKKILSLYS